MDTLRHNPKDPLAKTGPDYQRELFDRFSRDASGFSTADVIGAAANIVVNALRQAHSTREEAAKAYDEHAARIKGILMDHYDSTGRRKGIFPFAQTIVMPFVNGRDKI
jgi:hypothetical protein